MDQYTDVQHGQEKQQQSIRKQQNQETPSANIRKGRVGIIIDRRAIGNQDHSRQQLKSSKKMSGSSIGRVNTLPNPEPMTIIYQSQGKKRNPHKHHKNYSRQQQLQFFHNDIHKSQHNRSKSYTEHRGELQKQLQNLMVKKNRLDELKQNKNKLKSKLKQLEWKLKQIKNEDRVNSGRTKSTKYQTTDRHEKLHKQGTKHIRLKPITHKQDADQKKVSKIRVKQNKSNDKTNQQDVDSYYVGELHHKCLDCNHFNLKIEDIRIPASIKQEMKQLTQS